MRKLILSGIKWTAKVHTVSRLACKPMFSCSMFSLYSYRLWVKNLNGRQVQSLELIWLWNKNQQSRQRIKCILGISRESEPIGEREREKDIKQCWRLRSPTVCKLEAQERQWYNLLWVWRSENQEGWYCKSQSEGGRRWDEMFQLRY